MLKSLKGSLFEVSDSQKTPALYDHTLPGYSGKECQTRPDSPPSLKVYIFIHCDFFTITLLLNGCWPDDILAWVNQQT